MVRYWTSQSSRPQYRPLAQQLPVAAASRQAMRGELSPVWSKALNRFIGGHAAFLGASLGHAFDDLAQKEWQKGSRVKVTRTQGLPHTAWYPSVAAATGNYSGSLGPGTGRRPPGWGPGRAIDSADSPAGGDGVSPNDGASSAAAAVGGGARFVKSKIKRFYD